MVIKKRVLPELLQVNLINRQGEHERLHRLKAINSFMTETVISIIYRIKHYIEWPTKMSLFFFGKNFYKNKETFKIFSPQLLEVYRILLVETTLESMMFYYTFSVINTMFVPCTTLLHDSTAATRTLKLFTILLSISCGISLISLLIIVLSCLWIVFTNSVFQVPPQKIVK